MTARFLRAEAAGLPRPILPQPERSRGFRAAAATRRGAPDGGILARLHAALSGWIRRARARAELASLTDRELADIGLIRSEIDRALAQAEAVPAAGPARRAPAGAVPRPV